MSEFIDFKGKKLAYKTIVQNPDFPYLIFLHDSLGCITLWRDFPEKCIEGLPLNALIYDRVGYGQSDSFFELHRDHDYMHIEADRLVELMMMLKIDSAHLFGHSDGGTIALLAAARHPEMINSIIVEGSHIFVEDITIQGIDEAIWSYENRPLRQKLMRYHGDNTDNVFQLWTKTWKKPEFSDWNIVADLKNIICPTLVIQGVDDEFGSEAQVTGIIDNISSEVKSGHLINDAQHTPHKENLMVTLPLVKDFLRTNLDK